MIDKKNLNISKYGLLICQQAFLVFSKDISHAYTTGRGGIVCRGVAEIVEDKKDTYIVISSIPYRVNKQTLVERIAELVREKKIEIL